MPQEAFYDVVIVGSGLGGLVCAAILSKEGKRVCVLEKNEQIGGSLQTFHRNGVNHDTGVHYIGGLAKGQNLHRLFSYLGIMDRLELKRLDKDAFDVILLAGDKNAYPLAQSYENFQTQLLRFFPNEKIALQSYCEAVKDCCKRFPFYKIERTEQVDDIDLLRIPAKDFIASITPNKTLQNVLAGSSMLYVGDGKKTPFYVHALIMNSYIESSWRCAKGGDQLARLLAKVVKQHGGKLLRKATVTRVKEENGNAKFVELETGEQIFGKQFILNVHPTEALRLIDSTYLRPSYKQRLQRLENSIAPFVLNLTFAKNKVPYTNRNYYYFSSSDLWQAVADSHTAWPATYGFFEAVPQHNSQFLEAASVMTYMPWSEVQPWENSRHTTLHASTRDENYEVFKQQKARQLLALVAERFPTVVHHITACHVATPLTYRDYLASPAGSMYGIVKDFNEPIKTMISPNTRIENLFLTGQNIKMHGVLGVTISAFVTCFSLLGREYLIDKIIASEEREI